MLNIVVPMAGRGSRFASAGYVDPKPLIPIHGIPMIRFVIENLRPARPHKFIFICQRGHYQEYELAEKLAQWTPGFEAVLLDGVTDGAACTVLAAKPMIDNDHPLMIANSDQYVDIKIDDYLNYQDSLELDGLIMTMKADDPKWSFAATDDMGCVTQVAEKVPISSDATVGIYNFAQGRDFVQAAEEMINADERVNGEFYVAPVYNRLVTTLGKRVGIYDVGSEGLGMYGLGIPADLDLFIGLPLSPQVAERIRWK